jgi:AraC family transcriptional regulator
MVTVTATDFSVIRHDDVALPNWLPPSEPIVPNRCRSPSEIRTMRRRIETGHAWFWGNEDDTSIGVIYGKGGGCRLDVAGGTAAIWIPLRGALQVATHYVAHSLDTDDIVVTEHTTSVQACARGDSCWVAILGSNRAWGRLLADTLALDRQLLPEQYASHRALRRQAVTLARAVNPALQETALHEMADLIADMQRPLYAAIARCPGRTFAQKRQVFVRLQRVRFFMTACCERELDNGTLAQMASYSSHHFLRTFKAVYLETPHAYLVKQRLARARRLLVQDHMAITEIALICGFESPSAFSRLFRQRFGTTAIAARRRFHLDSVR